LKVYPGEPAFPAGEPADQACEPDEGNDPVKVEGIDFA